MAKDRLQKLKEQIAEARIELERAALKLALLEDRYQAELARKSGMLGKIATREGRSILVHRVRFVNEKPVAVTGFKLNRDGRPGYVEVTMYLDGGDITFTTYPRNGNGK